MTVPLSLAVLVLGYSPIPGVQVFATAPWVTDREAASPGPLADDVRENPTEPWLAGGTYSPSYSYFKRRRIPFVGMWALLDIAAKVRMWVRTD